jgi:RNA polymerase sigma factor (sigma-70 family)
MLYSSLEQFQNDAQLWQAFKSGDRAAFDLVYQRHVRGLYNYGFNLCHQASLTEDAIQDLFVYLYDHRNTLGPTDNIQFYLFRSLRRRLAKSQQRKDVLEADGYQFDQAQFICADISSQLIEDETTRQQQTALRARINDLPKRQREAIFLLYMEGFSYTEVADTMDLEVKSVYNLVNKAVQFLRQHLTNKEFSIALLLSSIQMGYTCAVRQP